MESKGVVNNITVYDDFAHHPTAIHFTLQGLRNKVGTARIIAIAELGSNTMRDGTHQDKLLPAFATADLVYLYLSEDSKWQPVITQNNVVISSNIDSIVQAVVNVAIPGDHILVMSNRGFGGIHQKLLNGINSQNKYII